MAQRRRGPPPGAQVRRSHRKISRLPLGPCDPALGATSLDVAEVARTGSDPLHRLETQPVVTDHPAFWERSLLENPRDLFLTPSTPGEAYIRLAKDSESLEIIESASADTSLVPPMFRAVAAMGLGLELTFVHTWLDVTEFTSRWFTDRGRAPTLPMVKGVSDLAAAQFSGADYF